MACVFITALATLSSNAERLCIEKVATPAESDRFINIVPVPLPVASSDDWMVAGTQNGVIELWSIAENDKVKRHSTPLLDLTDRVLYNGERGLLGVALHKQFASNGRMFVSYSCKGSEDCKEGSNVIAEFTASSMDNLQRLSVDKSSARIIKIVNQPDKNHNGGQILFSSNVGDPYLYAMFGDGGGVGDPRGSSQNLGSPLGKVLRLDIDTTNTPYSIPASNPFVNTAGALVSPDS